jgi:hypothetical protein
MTRSGKIVLAVVLIPLIVGGIAIALAIHYVGASGITRPIDNQFGDQHLKTAVALIELHKVRYGRYPQKLSELRYTGQWDQLHVTSVHYVAAPDGSKYYVEVTRGWMGKPTLDYPPEFWHGTGYSPELKPRD